MNFNGDSWVIVDADDLTALLASRRWVTRRVDRVEFLDLTTVRRTIALTLDLSSLARVRPPYGHRLIPLGWFVPWANAGAVLLDGDRHVVPYLTSRESDRLIEQQIEGRSKALGIDDDGAGDLLERVRAHREVPGVPGRECPSCTTDTRCASGYADLMSEKWGCRATRELLEKVYAWDPSKKAQARELAQILLAWQTNFVFFARFEAPPAESGWATLQLAFDQELREWEPPWEQRKRILQRVDLSRADSREWRKHISRGGPFHEDLDKLLPLHLRGFLARRKCPLVRRVGRRGVLGLTWHVAWHQPGGVDAHNHQVDVILPSELTAVRIRVLRARKGKRLATVADQVGSRATIVAPDFPDEDAHDQQHRPPLPTLFSLAITQRSPASWYGGVWIALLTGVAILATALWWLPKDQGQATDAITILIVAPTLVATLLSVRAGSEIAAQLTVTLRRLIAAVGVLAAICAIGLVAQDEPDKIGTHAPDLTGLKVLWLTVAALLLGIAAVLSLGARRIRRLNASGRRPAPRALKDPRPGKVINPDRRPPIPPPDRWLAADEGELVPWGWLNGPPGEQNGTHPPYSDRCYWQATCRTPLVKWVQEIFDYESTDKT